MSAPLILAIQPDRRQQPQLASIARQVSAELLLTESVERAMTVLADRLPDLILTPALLSHKDETALTERLREFGDVAAHIHTLTIPILETSASPSRKGGVLSSLRKQKRTGKSKAPVTAGCTVDTFAEQISIYLDGAVEARLTRKPAHTPRPATTSEAQPPAEETTPDSLPSFEELSAEEATSVVPEPPRETLERQPAGPAESDGLPTIEELSARTPPVPEPPAAAEMRMNAIAVITPNVSALPVPVAPVETGANAIATIGTGLAVHADNRPIPIPAVAPRVAELALQLPPAQLAAGIGVAAMPLPAPVETGVEAVTAMMPLVSAPAVQALVATPVAAPQVAELSVQLPHADTTGRDPGTPIVLPAPSGAVEMSMATVAAMVPMVKAANERPLPVPAVMSPLAELPMELPAHAAPARVAVPTVPENGSSVSVEAIAAMASVANAATADRLGALLSHTPFTAELSLKLPSTDLAAPAVAPVAPESSRSVELNMQAVAHIAPVIANQGLVPLPADAMRVSELRMELPPSHAHPGVLEVPELPAAPADANLDAVASMLPVANAASHHRAVPVPASLPQVVQLPMSLPSMAAEAETLRTVIAPTSPEPRIEVEIETATATADAATTDAAAPAVSATSALAVHKRAKKKAAQQQRKAARKSGKKPKGDPPADDSSLFDPDEVGFAALIAKLDEVAFHGDEAHMPDSNAGRQGRARKTSKHR